MLKSPRIQTDEFFEMQFSVQGNLNVNFNFEKKKELSNTDPFSKCLE